MAIADGDSLQQDSTKHYDLASVSVTAFLTGEGAQKVSGALNVIDRNDLQTISRLSLPEILNMSPGVIVQSGSAGTNKVMIRGIGSRSMYGTNRIRAWFGPIPLTTADGVSGLDELDPWLSGSTELIRGPSSALYGSGLGGAIVFQPDYLTEEKVRVLLEAGSFGYLKAGITGRAENEENGVSAGISTESTLGERQNSTSEHHTGYLLWERRKGSMQFTTLLLLSDFFAQIPSSLNSEQLLEDPRMAAPNWLSVEGYEKNTKLLGGFSLRYRISNRWSTRATVYGNGLTAYERRPFNTLDDQSAMAGFKAMAERLAGRTYLALGTERYGELYRAVFYETIEEGHGGELSSSTQSRTQQNFYVWMKYLPTDRLSLTAGFNLNSSRYRLSTDIEAPVYHVFNPVLSPRLGINYRIYKKNYLYFSAGHGLSHPTTEETLSPPGLLNPELRPEQGNTVEFGIRGKTEGERLNYEITAYNIWLKDQLLTRRLDEETFYGINGGNSSLRGLEIMLRLRIWENGNLASGTDLISSAWLSDNRFTDFIDDGIDYSGHGLPGIPD